MTAEPLQGRVQEPAVAGSGRDGSPAAEREVRRFRHLLEHALEVVDVALDGSPGEAGDLLAELSDRLRAELAA